MQVDLTKEEWETLAEHLRDHIRYTGHPAASSLVHLRAILIKLDPEAVQEPLPDQKRERIAQAIGCRTFWATGITAYLANGGALEHAQERARMRVRTRPSSTIARKSG